ncbi:MAG: tRNA 2-thiouridine(34) synthase MnmA [Patescibacteria group bacterium]|nr:tRNA 2-thiouridine(34) synthase MnmA [Patescibacteria group bacterium]
MVKIKNKKVIVAMSGGVDSSVAAKLLKDQGYNLAGIFLHFWKDETPLTPLVKGGDNSPFPFSKGGIVENKCCSLEALIDARRVCQKVGLPLYTLNFSDIFKKKVVDYFLDEYKKGNTPNPCIRCNKLVKLGWLVERAKKLGFNYVASGHYALIKKTRKQENNHRQGGTGKTKFIYKLYKGKDEDKDQSYFLYTLTQEQLSRLLFPLGDYKKEEVRRIAKKFGLPVAAKKESQEICFIPGKSHNEFLKKYLKLKPGPIKTLDGIKVGEHQGLPLYTIGQRKGVEVGGIGPFYVAKRDYKTNTLYVVKDGNDPVLYNDKLVVENVNWIAGEEPKLPLICEAVIRYRHKPAKCKVEKLENKKTRKQKNKKTITAKAGQGKQEIYLVKFEEPQRAITPGQSVVFYNKDEVLGGGVIGQ